MQNRRNCLNEVSDILHRLEFHFLFVVLFMNDYIFLKSAFDEPPARSCNISAVAPALPSAQSSVVFIVPVSCRCRHSARKDPSRNGRYGEVTDDSDDEEMM